ncbi:hypothetical protein FJY84_07745 [Candidatus Bathyarchaeota archaeon]|nr:hypothetical protein [Candidatus Bathyarchaeota archaeon]
MSNFDKVISSLKYLGLALEIKNYNSRYLIQKITYINQALGMDTNYNFTIYIAGPYSKQLTRDYFNESEEIFLNKNNYQLTYKDTKRLDKIKRCCEILTNSPLLEATSTIIYLKKEGIVNDDEIIKKIKILKPHISYENIILGLVRAKELLFKPEYLTKDLKEENDLIDSIENME